MVELKTYELCVKIFLLPTSDLGRMADLKLVDKWGKELVELKLQVLS